MAASVIKRVRMKSKEAQELRRLARELGVTESELLRQGLDLVKRRQSSREALENLIAMIPPERVNNPPKKVRFALR